MTISSRFEQQLQYIDWMMSNSLTWNGLGLGDKYRTYDWYHPNFALFGQALVCHKPLSSISKSVDLISGSDFRKKHCILVTEWRLNWYVKYRKRICHSSSLIPRVLLILPVIPTYADCQSGSKTAYRWTMKINIVLYSESRVKSRCHTSISTSNLMIRNNVLAVKEFL